MAYAIIEMGGKQYRVEEGDSVVVDRLDAKEGAKVSPRALLFADGDRSVLEGAPDKVAVSAVVAEHLLGEKLRVFKFRAKKRYKVTTGYRSQLTRIEITGIKAGAGAQTKPAAKPAAPKESKGADKTAAKKPPAKKPAAKKPAAKKPPAKKPPAKKPPAKKPAQKKE